MMNRSDIPDELIQRMIDSAQDAYHMIFPKPGCDVEITVCRDLEDLADLAEEYVGELAGLVHAFHDFLSGRGARPLDLVTLMEKPYYETLDVAELKSELKELVDLMRERT